MPGLLSAVLHCSGVYGGMGCFWHKHNSEMVLTSLCFCVLIPCYKKYGIAGASQKTGQKAFSLLLEIAELFWLKCRLFCLLSLKNRELACKISAET